MRTEFVAIVLLLNFTACAGEEKHETDAMGALPQHAELPRYPQQTSERPAARLEAWSKYDDPVRFDGMQYKIALLPTEGEVGVVPWAGSSYPAAYDSINHLWAGPGSESPTRKYERAFGVENLEAYVSHKHGLGTSRGHACASQADCAPSQVCGKYAGASIGQCTPAWWSLNHGWAAAATLHPEPRHAVLHNGVTFEVQDIKALLAMVYDKAHTQQISLRSTEPSDDIARDATGRPLGQSTRDTNPGTYHILITNFIGRHHQSFIEDGDIAQEVENRALRSYELLSQYEIDAADACGLLGVKSNAGYPYNAEAVRWAYVKLKTQYILPSAGPLGFIGVNPDAYTHTSVYEYVLELDSAGYIIGGEWVGDSKLKHPDFVWLAYGLGEEVTFGGRLRAADVLELARSSAL